MKKNYSAKLNTNIFFFNINTKRLLQSWSCWPTNINMLFGGWWIKF